MAECGRFLLLSVVQGLTEFLPVSSSGHLVLLEHIFRFQENRLAWVVAFHSGTLLSIIIYFRKEIRNILYAVLPFKRISGLEKRKYRRLLYLIFCGSLPAAVAGMLFYNFFCSAFQSVELVTLALFINGCWLLLSEKIYLMKENKLELEDLSWKQALFIGGGQALALIPGISRAGTTIGCGYICGLKKETAFNFAFLLALPVTSGVVLFSLGKLDCSVFFLLFIILFTALVGYAALGILSRIIKKSSLRYFAFYCWIISLWSFCWISRG